MARPTIPPHVLAQRGVAITLLDGSERKLCYTFSSLMTLEEAFGSINAAVAAISSSDSAQIGGTVKLLAAGLEHEVDTNGERLSDPQHLRYLVDSTQINEYGDAIGAAFDLAFPTAVEVDESDPTQGATSSPGPSGSTSEQSSSVEASTSSGA